MKARAVLGSLIVLAASGMGLSNVWADSSAATCQVRKDGDTKQGLSGPCTFSQRQGYIDIDLRNGETISLSPANQPNHFKDQKGHNVVRTQAGGNTHEYKWEGGRKLTVTFGGQAHSGGGGGGGADGGTPADLRDLVNGPLVGGEVEDEMSRRGWRHAKDDVSGSDVYSYFGKGSRCVVVRLDAGRHVRSIANGMESSCQ